MKRKLTVLAVIGLFFAPVIIAVVLNSRWVDWTPAPGRSHGELVEPVVELGSVLPSGDWKGKWHLVRYQPGGCDEACLEALYWLRQARKAQDRHVPDIGLLLVSPVPLDAGRRAEILRLSPAWRVVDGEAGEGVARLLPGPGEAGSTYIMDPQSNIMMRYPAGTDPNGIRKDLDRLLTWTQEQQ